MTGIAIAACGEEGRPLLDFFTSVSVVMMRVTTWIIYLAPVGVCFLIAGQIIIVSCKWWFRVQSNRYTAKCDH